MKCGTTTLWEDLRQHPDLVLAQKEAGLLHRFPGDDHRLQRLYAREAAMASSTQRFGEVCTTYAMLPHLPDVSERARSLLGPGLQVVYLVRHPVDRVVSHHRHDTANGTLRLGIDEAVHADARLLDYTRYVSQLRPWFDTIGQAAVHVVVLESYARNRQESLSALCRVLGVGPPPTTHSLVHNRSGDSQVARGRLRHVLASGGYRRVIRPLLSERLRRSAAHCLLPSTPPAPEPPSEETVSFIRRELRAEIDALCNIVGRPVWPDLC